MRTIVFVDYWNLQLTLGGEDARVAGLTGAQARNHRFEVDWFGLGPALTQLAAVHASPTPGTALPLQFQQSRIYTSANPATEFKYRNWALNTLGRKAGVHVHCLDRKPKRNPNCPACYQVMDICPHCKAAINATQEKGVDTLLVTELLSLGLDGSYDVALLVSQDGDMGPAAAHLISKGRNVIQVGIGNFGKALAASCWAEFDLFPHRNTIRRPAAP